MGMRGTSPKSQQRNRVFETYRGRGHRNNNLWLVYSVKTRRDWILNSDRKLIHWMAGVLESNLQAANANRDLAVHEIKGFQAQLTEATAALAAARLEARTWHEKAKQLEQHAMERRAVVKPARSARKAKVP